MEHVSAFPIYRRIQLDKLIRTTLGLKRGDPSRAGPGAVAPLAASGDTNGLLSNRIMNICVPKMHKICQAAEEILAFKKELCSMELVTWLLSQLSTLTLLAQQFAWSLKNVQTQRPNKWHFRRNLHASYLPITVCSLHSSQQASLCAYGVQASCVAPRLQSCNSDDTSPSQLDCPGATPGSGNTVTTVSFSPAYCTLSHIPTTSTFNTRTSNCAMYEHQLNACPTVPTTGLFGRHSYICK